MEEWKYALLAVGILFIIMAMFSLGRNRKKQSSGRDTARDHVERARQKQGVRDELEALMVDINRMAKDLGGQLDAKVVRIEKAVRDADQRIAQLQALREQLEQPLHAQPQASAVPTDADDLHPPHRPPDQADPLTRDIYALADQGIGAHDIAEQLGEHVGKVELILALRGG